MSVLSNTTALLGKELRTEFRSRELLTTTIVFILIVMVLLFFLGSLGVATAGTALSAISAQARMRELMLPLLLLPLLTPVLVASTEVTAGLLDRQPFVQWKGVGFLAVFDVVFLTALWI